jgi:hypothetical protein
MSYLYVAIIIGIFILVFLLIPKKIYTTNFIEKYNNSKFKNAFNIVLLLKVVLSIYTGALLIQQLNYDMFSIYYFIGGIALIVMMISRMKNGEIIELSTWFVVAAIAIYMLAFLHIVPLDFSHLKSFDFQFPNFQFYLIILSIILDNLLVLLSDKKELKFNKFSIVIPLITQFIFMIFELYQMLLASGDKLFLDYEYIGFVSLSFQKTSNYIGNLSFVYLFIITMATVINSSYILSFVRHSYKKGKNILFDIFIIILIVASTIFINKLKFNNLVEVLMYVSLFGIILIFWLLKEAYCVRKVKE